MATLLYLGIFGAFSFVCVLSRILVVRLFDFVSTLVLLAQCTFLHNLLMLNISFGCCRHSVSNTFVQLTEGRSARDKPKQLPAKKKTTNGEFPCSARLSTSFTTLHYLCFNLRPSLSAPGAVEGLPPYPLAQGHLGSNPRGQVVGASRFHALVDS